MRMYGPKETSPSTDADVLGFSSGHTEPCRCPCVSGAVTIEKFGKDVRVEIFDDHAIWELMYFGETRSSREPALMLAASE